jgi:hypothetical protein
MTRLRVLSLYMLCLALLAACGSTATEPPLSNPKTEPGSVSSPAVPTESQETPTGLTSPLPTVGLVPTLATGTLPTVEMAPLFTADLMKALGSELQLRLEDIRLVSVEQVDWPNSCMGVERKGVMCLDVITPGYLLVFETTSGTYEVHTNIDGTYFLIVSQTKLFTSPPPDGG